MAFLATMILLGLAVAGVVVGFTWVCDKCEELLQRTVRPAPQGRRQSNDAANQAARRVRERRRSIVPVYLPHRELGPAGWHILRCDDSVADREDAAKSYRGSCHGMGDLAPCRRRRRLRTGFPSSKEQDVMDLTVWLPAMFFLGCGDVGPADGLRCRM